MQNNLLQEALDENTSAERLREFENLSIRNTVANNPNTSQETLQELVHDANEIISHVALEKLSR